MIKGTTWQFDFKLPYAFNQIVKIDITFWQDNYNGPSESRPLPIKKKLSQCRQGSDPNILSVFLNKEETMRFTDDRKAYVQYIGVTTEGSDFGCKKKLITVHPVEDDSIFDENLIPTPPPDDDDIIILDGFPIA